MRYLGLMKQKASRGLLIKKKEYNGGSEVQVGGTHFYGIDFLATKINSPLA